MYYAGVDVGSISTEAVVVDDSGKVAGIAVGFTGANSVGAAKNALEEAASQAGTTTDELGMIVGTGYGRERVPFAHQSVTEITCHARGAITLFPSTRTVVDIGGQDSKAIKVGESGKVVNFQMNDKCAAGTGRFLEVMARALEVELAEMGELGILSDTKVSVSSVCTVFAESEVVGLIHQGHDKKDIIKGIHSAVADRTRALAGRVGIEPEVTMTGGVAKNMGVVKALEERIGHPLNLPEDPQIVGALGAALIARDRGTEE